MERKSKLKKVKEEAINIFIQIQQYFGFLVGISLIIEKPEIIAIPSDFPNKINVEHLTFNINEIIGLNIPNDNRPNQKEILLTMAKRSLFCESLEFATNILSRSSKILHTGEDPYETIDHFQPNFKDLNSGKKGKAGCLLDPNEREFFDKCLGPLRHITRHSNAEISQKKKISYSGNICGTQVNLSLDREECKYISVTLKDAYEIFELTRKIVLKGLDKAIDEVEKSKN